MSEEQLERYIITVDLCKMTKATWVLRMKKITPLAENFMNIHNNGRQHVEKRIFVQLTETEANKMKKAKTFTAVYKALQPDFYDE